MWSGICCFDRKKSDNNHASHFFSSRPRGRTSELELDSESVSSETTWLGCFSSDVEVDTCLDVAACASLVFGFLVACWLGPVLLWLLLSPVFCLGI